MVALSYGTLHDPVDKLTSAAASGDLSQVRSILDRGAAVDGRDRAGKTALISASKNGHKEVIEFLLANGADINSRGKYGKSALMPAAAAGHIEVVKLLLDSGADVNARDEYYQTCFDVRFPQRAHGSCGDASRPRRRCQCKDQKRIHCTESCIRTGTRKGSRDTVQDKT